MSLEERSPLLSWSNSRRNAQRWRITALWGFPIALISSVLMLVISLRSNILSPSSGLLNILHFQEDAAEGAGDELHYKAGERVSQGDTGNDVKLFGRIFNFEGTTKETLPTSESKAITSPHIFLFTVDDLGWNDVGMYSTDIPKATPFITSLAKKGVTLSRYYAQPSCTPSRVSIMTAKFAHRNGFQNYDMQHVDQVSMLCPFILC